MKLDKRYVTDIDLTGRTTTGDPEGERLEEHVPPGREAHVLAREGSRGEVELAIPAASAVKIGVSAPTGCTGRAWRSRCRPA